MFRNNSPLLFTLYVPLQVGKCTSRCTSAQGWEPLFWRI